MRLSSPAVTVTPGRYRFACYARGLDVGSGIYGFSEDVNFADDAYVSLKKSGTFGWTRLEIVKDVPKTQEIFFRIGLWGSGRLWVDDAKLERVSADVALTNGPVWGREEKSIAPPAPLDAKNRRSLPRLRVSQPADMEPMLCLRRGFERPFRYARHAARSYSRRF